MSETSSEFSVMENSDSLLHSTSTSTGGGGDKAVEAMRPTMRLVSSAARAERRPKEEAASAARTCRETART
jgi:hypothetical protein